MYLVDVYRGGPEVVLNHGSGWPFSSLVGDAMAVIPAACGSTSFPPYRSIRNGISVVGQRFIPTHFVRSGRTCIHVGTVVVLTTSETATSGVLPVLA